MIRGSSLPRFTKCNGFLTLDLPEKESDYAKEGTAFHELLELKFLNKFEDTMKYAKNGVMFDADMHFFAKRILPLIPQNAVSETEVSYNVSKTNIVGHVDYHWEDSDDSLVVMDIKYGHRVVEVENNWQLIGYALGVVIKKQKRCQKVTLRVIQPRAHHYAGWVRDWIITPEQLERFYIELSGYVQAYEEGKIHFGTSEYCRYCPALEKDCPAINKAFYNAVDVVVNESVRDDLSDEQLSQMLKTYDRVKDIFKIKEEALNDLAKSRLKAGNIIDGFGLEPNYSNRKWISGITPDSVKTLTGVDLTKQVFISPAEAEKLNIDQSIIDSLSVKEQKGYMLKKMNNSKYADTVFGKKEG